jgi:hypothetical protein
MELEPRDLTSIQFAPRRDGPEGLGGWLILPMIGLFLSPLMALASAAGNLLPLFQNRAYAALTTPGLPNYDTWWAPYILGMCMIVVAQFAGSIVLLVLAFNRARWFPRGMIAFYLLMLLATVWDMAILMHLDLPGANQASAITAFGRSAVVSMVWIPYFLSSRRVRNTFVRDSVGPVAAPRDNPLGPLPPLPSSGL